MVPAALCLHTGSDHIMHAAPDLTYTVLFLLCSCIRLCWNDWRQDKYIDLQNTNKKTNPFLSWDSRITLCSVQFGNFYIGIYLNWYSIVMAQIMHSGSLGPQSVLSHSFSWPGLAVHFQTFWASSAHCVGFIELFALRFTFVGYLNLF